MIGAAGQQLCTAHRINIRSGKSNRDPSQANRGPVSARAPDPSLAVIGFHKQAFERTHYAQVDLPLQFPVQFRLQHRTQDISHGGKKCSGGSADKFQRETGALHSILFPVEIRCRPRNLTVSLQHLLNRRKERFGVV